MAVVQALRVKQRKRRRVLAREQVVVLLRREVPIQTSQNTEAVMVAEVNHRTRGLQSVGIDQKLTETKDPLQ